MSHTFYINFAISRLWKWGYYHFQFNKLLQYALMPDQHNRYQLFLPSLYFVLQAEIIHKHEYKTWRSTGIAFEPREATYDVPNKTLASGVVVNQVSAQIKQSAACHWDLIAKKWWWLKLKKFLINVYTCICREGRKCQEEDTGGTLWPAPSWHLGSKVRTNPSSRNLITCIQRYWIYQFDLE